MAAEGKEVVAEEATDVRNAPQVREALSRIEEGDRTQAVVRAALLLLKAGTGRRRLSSMKRARELVGQDVGLTEMPAEAAQRIVREQSYIVDYDPVNALTTLPKLLRSAEDRRKMLDLLDRIEGHIEANEKQVALFGEIRRLLAGEVTPDTGKAESITMPRTGNPAGIRREEAARRESARHARNNRRSGARS